MGLPRFHLPPEELKESRVKFEKEALDHLKARRVRPGRRISLFDGLGNEAVGLIVKMDRNWAEAEIIERPAPFPEPGIKITLGLGLCRWERLRMAVEKATELGASEIRPLLTERSRPAGKGIKGKLERIVIESLKQCCRSLGPKIHEPATLDRALDEGAGFDLKLYFEQGGRHLTEMELPTPKSVFLLVGPEGGLTRMESGLALDSGFIPTVLSSAVLRTETAALAGLALVSALWERPRTVNVEKPEKGLNMSFSEKEPPDDSCPKPNPFLSLWGHLQDPQVAILWITGLIIGLLIISLGSALAPFFSAIVFAYMLEGMVNRLTRVSFPRWAAVTVVFLLFMSILVGLFLWLIPLLIEQLSALIAALPSMAKSLQNLAAELQTKYAKDLDPTYLQELIPRVTREMEQVARKIVTGSLAYLPGLFGVIIYLMLVPLLVLVFLKDKEMIVQWVNGFLPTKRELFTQIIKDVDQQMSNFFRGKIWEMIIISVASVTAFLILDFRFALLLGLISGVSVLIPYLGIILATIPIVLVALFQWGFSLGALKVLIAFAVIQLIDGNLLAPLLVGNMIRIHPAAVIFAVLACGHLWGILGVVMAFPMAIVIKSLLDLALPYIRKKIAEKEEAASS